MIQLCFPGRRNEEIDENILFSLGSFYLGQVRYNIVGRTIDLN